MAAFDGSGLLPYMTLLFTFRFLNILIVLAGGLILFAGLALLSLQRRNAILRGFLTPEEPDIEKEFFKRREKPAVHEEAAEEPPVETGADSATEDEVGWGDPIGE